MSACKKRRGLGGAVLAQTFSKQVGKVELAELGCTVNIRGLGLAVSQELSAATMLILVWEVLKEDRRS
jgi:hypothetical protein